MSVAQTANTGWFNRFLATVEWLGNLLPHPVTLFALFATGIVLLSGVLGYFEVSVVDPRPEGSSGRAADGLIKVVSLLNAEGLQRIVTGLVTNFTGFAPLGNGIGSHAGGSCRRTFGSSINGNARTGHERFKAHGNGYGCFCRNCLKYGI